MNFQLNGKTGNWLGKLNGKRIDKIYQVDYNDDRHNDEYLPWLFLITFSEFDEYLEIEGDFDGSHLKINLRESSLLENKLKEYNFPNEPDLWQVYETKMDETLGKLLSKKIDFIEFGVDKDEFDINGTKIYGQKQYFNFIRFNCEDLKITIFEGSSTGLGVSDYKDVKLNFNETFEIYNTI
ncbi:hypothetical protein NYZ99_20695 [Maribacter litopenaei]|uniref:DUF1851 domain-containing protein n=1 Tax=Maribacter litopenaei TaxID=2976127 RepID=A0ABY5Y9R3_9FLAO|nr:hypothetical protein [Maribacter litopenaei]UWX55067.1 hypothetical protein NYZ99_20695 [Maribacter litopenaei]